VLGDDHRLAGLSPAKMSSGRLRRVPLRRLNFPPRHGLGAPAKKWAFSKRCVVRRKRSRFVWRSRPISD